MLKILLKQEKPNLYFSSIDGIEGVYAQGTTSHECLSNLESVLREVLSLKIETMQNLSTDVRKLEMTF